MATNFSGTFVLSEVPITIYQIPSGCFLVHSTNCLSNWGPKSDVGYMFPEARRRYEEYCSSQRLAPTDRWPPPTMAGTCHIIPPQQADINLGHPAVSVVCLFTSWGYGRPNRAIQRPGLDRQSRMLENTEVALANFRRLLEQMKANGQLVGDVVIYSPHFISGGTLSVGWDRTQVAVQNAFFGFNATWNFLTSAGPQLSTSTIVLDSA